MSYGHQPAHTLVFPTGHVNSILCRTIPKETSAKLRSAGFQTCCVADFQVGNAWKLRTIRGFGNPRHSRLGSLRYADRVLQRSPKGLWAPSPGLRGTSYPGYSGKKTPAPKGLRQELKAVATPFGVDLIFITRTQGSSFLATPGFEPESVWDSFVAGRSVADCISWLYPKFFSPKVPAWSPLKPANPFASSARSSTESCARSRANNPSRPAAKSFTEGDPGDGVYLVKNGQVEISSVLSQGARRVFSQIGPGGLFGEMAVLELRPRSATATAVKDTTAYFIPRGELLSLIERSPGLALSILQVISHRLREFNQHHLREVLQAERLAVIGRFARSIVHDLKNPLNIIGLTTEMACRPNATPEFRATAQDRVRRQVDRISELVSEILYFTQGADTSAALAPMDYQEFLNGFFDELHEEAALKSAQLQLAGPPPPVKLLIDPKRLRRVFFNLIHNACDVMPDGGDIVPSLLEKSPRTHH